MHPLHLLVHQFTREHTEHIENPDGTNEYVKVHSYLTQLEHAKNANRGTGTTSGGGQVPVSLVAVDLLIEIEKITNRNQPTDRKSTRLNSSHVANAYADFCLK